MEIMTGFEEQDKVARKFNAIRKRVAEKLEKFGCQDFNLDLLRSVLEDASICEGRVAVATAHDGNEKSCVRDGDNVVYYALTDSENGYFPHVLYIYAYNTVRRRETHRRKFLQWMQGCRYPLAREISDCVNVDEQVKICAFGTAVDFVRHITPLMTNEGKFIGQEVVIKSGKLTFVPNKPIAYLLGNTCFVSMTKHYDHDFSRERIFYPH